MVDMKPASKTTAEGRETDGVTPMVARETTEVDIEAALANGRQAPYDRSTQLHRAIGFLSKESRAPAGEGSSARRCEMAIDILAQPLGLFPIPKPGREPRRGTRPTEGKADFLSY
jgi:hypothetical protein